MQLIVYQFLVDEYNLFYILILFMNCIVIIN